jgi:prevent-host-death family protein
MSLMAAAEIPFTQARASLADLVGRVAYGGERVVLTRHGRRAVALVPITDLERLEAMDAGTLGPEQVIRLGQRSAEPTDPTVSPPAGKFDVAAHSGDPTAASRSYGS